MSGLSWRFASAALILIPFGSALPLISQTDPAQSADSQNKPVAHTLSLGEADRTIKLDVETNGTMKFQNGFFVSWKRPGHVVIRDKDGHTTQDLTLSPPRQSPYPPSIEDIAVFKDGSIVASWVFRLPHDDQPYFSLLHYDPAGNMAEQIDLGQWRTSHICIADDKSIWALSFKQLYGQELYSPDEGVLRNYKFGGGLLRAVVPRSNFPQYGYYYPNAAIDCSGQKVHAITDDGQWIEYAPDSDPTIKKIDQPDQASGLAWLSGDHIYSIVQSSGEHILAELLPSKDSDTLHWAPIPPEKSLPANTRASTATPDQPTELIKVTSVLGVDHANGEQLVYRTSDGNVVWSKPLFSGATNH